MYLCIRVYSYFSALFVLENPLQYVRKKILFNNLKSLGPR